MSAWRATYWQYEIVVVSGLFIFGSIWAIVTLGWWSLLGIFAVSFPYAIYMLSRNTGLLDVLRNTSLILQAVMTQRRLMKAVGDPDVTLTELEPNPMAVKVVDYVEKFEKWAEDREKRFTGQDRLDD